MKESYIGVDVGKKELFLSQNMLVEKVDNSEGAIALWLKKHPQAKKAIWVYEATGGYERLLKLFLHKRDILQHQVHPNHVRYYARSAGLLAKTDTIDASVLEQFALERQLTSQEFCEKNTKLKAYLARRKQVITMQTQEKNRREFTVDETMLVFLEEHLSYLSQAIAKLDKLIEQEIKRDEKLKKQRTLYESVPCIGRQTANQLITGLPELLTEELNSLSALVGIAPINRDSGKQRGKRYIQGGRANIRSALYMAVLSGLRYNSVIREFYNRLKSKGKPSKVAIVACMRKLLMILKSIAVRQTPWVEEYQPEIA